MMHGPINIRTAFGSACPGNWRARFHSFYLCNTRIFLANSLKNYCQLFNHLQNPSSPGQVQASISVEIQHESEVFEGNQTASGEAPVLPTCRNDL